MSFAMILKMFADCSLSFAILGMVETEFTVPLLIPAVLYAVSAGIAAFFEEKSRPVLRRLCALLPWGCLLFGSNLLQILLLAVPAAYCSLVILFGVLELEYYTYRQFLLRSLLLMGVGCFMVGVWSFVNQAVLEQPPLEIQSLFRYGLVHLVCSIVLLRQLRLGIGARAEGNGRQMTTMLTVVGTIILCTMLGEPFLQQGVKIVVGAVLAVVAIPFMLVVELLVRLSKHTSAQSKHFFLESKGRVDEIRKGLQQVIHNIETAPEPEPVDISNFVTVAIVVILVVAAGVLLIKSFQKQRQTVYVAETVGSVPKLPKKKKQPLLSNRNKVRQTYRSFLRTEQALGMKLLRSDTSEDVLGRIHRNTDRAGANDLRNVYLAARYDERHNISRDQVEEAKRALKAARKKS